MWKLPTAIGIKGRAFSNIMLDIIIIIAKMPISGLNIETISKNIPPIATKNNIGGILRKNIAITIPKNIHNRSWKKFEKVA